MQKKENKIKIYCNLMDGVVEQWLSEKVPYMAIPAWRTTSGQQCPKFWGLLDGAK